MTDKIKTGLQGENIAADFLQAKGYEILIRNYRYKHAEIDLIAFKGNVLVFVEVKTRSSTRFGEPEQFVNSKKIQKISEGANQYLIENDWSGNIRFDIVSVVLSGGLPEITHFEDVTEPQ